ncbi:hypothetical protein P7C73_g1722, partial [Tremellales sp. Uapishka_1]
MERLRTTEWAKSWGWQMFTVNIGTSAVYVSIGSVPYAFNGQHAFGCCFFFMNILWFIVNLIMVARRAINHPKIFKHSFYDQGEGVWFPVTVLAVATLIIGIINYGIPYCGSWLIVTCEVLFWIYVFLGVCQGLITQNTFRVIPRPLRLVGPSDALEVFPLMLCGTIGGVLAPHLYTIDAPRALVIVLFSYTMQGLGFFLGMIKLSVWMTHHITLPRAAPKILPSYMIAAGPPGFTALAVVNLGHAALDIFPAVGFLSTLSSPSPDPMLVAQIFSIVGFWWALLMMGMVVWFLVIFAGSMLLAFIQLYRKGIKEGYSMSLWATTFPLAGFTSCLGRFATLMPSKGYGVLNIIFTCFIFVMWAINIVGTFTLLYHGELPGAPKEFSKDEFDAAMRMQDPEEDGGSSD